MAKLKSVISIEGTLNDLTFYKTKDGNLVKTKSGVSGTRIASDPAFARTRENGSEFGTAAKAGKLMRSALRNLMAKASDGRVTSRLTQLMRQILVFDATSNRGERNLTTAMANVAAQALLNGFNFNINAVLGTVLAKPFTVDTTTGVIAISGVVPLKDLAFPVGATNVTFHGAWARLDFTDQMYEAVLSNVVDLPIDNTSTTVTLTPVGSPKITGTNVFALEIEFSQKVNGQEYSLNNGTFNCLCIVGVK
jgi:hypothetical protein